MKVMMSVTSFFFFFLILPIWPRENVGAFRGCMKWCCAGELRLKKHKVRVCQRETHRTGVIKVQSEEDGIQAHKHSACNQCSSQSTYLPSPLQSYLRDPKSIKSHWNLHSSMVWTAGFAGPRRMAWANLGATAMAVQMGQVGKVSEYICAL